MLQQFTRRVLRHKRLVALSWLVLTVIGMMAAGPASEALDQRFSVPGREGWEASQEIVKVYGNGGESLPLVPVVGLPEGESVRSPGVRASCCRSSAPPSGVPGSRVAGFGTTGDRAFVSEDGRTAFVYVFPKRSDDAFGLNVDAQRDLRDALRSHQGRRRAGARDRLRRAAATPRRRRDGPGVLLEALVGGFGALIVLVFVFGSPLALVPLGMAICSVLTSFLLLWGLTAITDVSPIVQFLVALIGLGISIDYALLIVVRWREEREKGLENEEAVVPPWAPPGAPSSSRARPSRSACWR